jgi:predicted ATPase/transcriptional regulator with XRE-family HTH domain
MAAMNGKNGVERPTFAALLKASRRAARLTQEELAGRAAVSVRTISGLESGARHIPYRETVRLLAEALRLAPGERATFMDAARSDEASEASTDAFTRDDADVATASRALCTGVRPQPAPVPATPLIGRERETRAVGALLRRPQLRLLTLSGPPGVGKTRLAVQVAAKVEGAFSDGVCFVALAPLEDPQHVIPAIAQAVGIRVDGRRDVWKTLIAALRERRMLLLLDNFEHVLAAADAVAGLLAACGGVKALVTSRATLHLKGEQVFPVSPLPLPDQAAEPTPRQLAQAPSVSLFLSCVQRVKPGFVLTRTNAAAIAAICRRLDGLPLAIELVAARIKLLPPDALLTRLDHRLPLLTGGARDLPHRQQTLRAALEWSYDLLDAREQAAFRLLAVFAGGASLEAAEAVCNACAGCAADEQGGHGERAALDALTSLLDKSLLMGEEGAHETRVRMLETVREYAWERLVASGGAGEARRTHVQYYVEHMEATEQLPEHIRVPRLVRYDVEIDNFRAALRWAMQSRAVGDVELGLRLAGALGMFWYACGYLNEGLMWLRGLLARAGDEELQCTVAVGVRAKAHYIAGWIALDQGENARAAALLAQSLALYRQTDDVAAQADALIRLGCALLGQGNQAQAAELFGESLELRRGIGDAAAVADSLNYLGKAAAKQRRYEQATAFLEEGLAIYRSLNEQWGVMLILSNLGDLARVRGDYALAASLHEEGLVLARRGGDVGTEAYLLSQLARVAQAQRNAARAVTLWQESLALYRSIGHAYASAYCLLTLAHLARDAGQHAQALALYWESLTLYNRLAVTEGAAECLEGLASVASTRGEAERAAWLCGATASLREAIGAPLAAEDTSHGRAVATARGELGEERFRSAWAAGHGLPADRVIASALGTAAEMRDAVTGTLLGEAG